MKFVMYFYGIRVCKIFPKVELLADQFLSFLKYLQISTRGFNFVSSKLGLFSFPFRGELKGGRDRSIDRSQARYYQSWRIYFGEI